MRSLLVLALALLSCSSDSFPPVSKVDSLRVLAVRADRPIAAPGDRVHLDTLVVDPPGGGRAIAFAWSTCVNPGSQEVADCAAASAPFAPGGATFDVVVPDDALASRPPEMPVGIVGVLFAACAGELRLAKTAAAPIGCVDENGQPVGRDGFMWGEKRIVVAAGVENANPTIAGARFDDQPWPEGEAREVVACAEAYAADCADALRHRVALVPAPGARETFGDTTEDLVAYFFVSGGGVADDIAREDDARGDFGTDFAAADGARPRDTITLWLVLRDDRGGVGWTTRTLRVQ